MKINYSDLYRFDRQLDRIENKYSPELLNIYKSFGVQAKRQAKNIRSGSQKKINLNRKVKADYQKRLENKLNQYFDTLEKAGVQKAKKDIKGFAETKAERLKLANTNPSDSISKNKKWANVLSKRQIKGFEDSINKAVKQAIKDNPKITEAELNQLIDRKAQSFINLRLENTIKNESNRIQTQVGLEIAKKSGLVTAARFIATLDNRTTVNCKTKNNTVIAINDSRLREFVTPQHPKCRSYLEYISNKDNKTKLTSNAKINLLILRFDNKKVPGMPEYYAIQQTA